ncbi:MAG TPA: thiamine-phosphate kinase [Casimicrobiaceae bacterium]|nr:thiamine-phosphate kinase [Casimicrobiaceae bacterium]
MNEFELIERYFRRPPQHPDLRVGIGDDAAVIAPAPGMEYVLTVDMLVEGRHFVAGTDPERLGHKTLAVNLSDLAAMGARPRYVLLAVALPDADPVWVAGFMRGFDALARRHDVELIGGDTTRGPRNLCVTAIGELPAGSALLRSGARPGDAIYVSGTLGDAALALAVAGGRTDVDPQSRAALALRLDAPEPRVALGVALRGIASGAIDLSDGLIGDLGHILTESRVGATVDLTSVPCSPALRARLEGGERDLALACLLAGGDDYELCFTAPPAMRERIDALALALQLPLSMIGSIAAEAGLRIRDGQGQPLSRLPQAFDHFR